METAVFSQETLGWEDMCEGEPWFVYTALSTDRVAQAGLKPTVLLPSFLHTGTCSSF